MHDQFSNRVGVPKAGAAHDRFRIGDQSATSTMANQGLGRPPISREIAWRGNTEL